MITIKKFLPLAAVLLMGGGNAYAQNATPDHDHVASSPASPRGALREVLSTSDKYHEPTTIDRPLSPNDVDAEFADFDEMMMMTNEEEVRAGRRLQSKNKNKSGGTDGSSGGSSGGSVSETTKCNTWCKLKESLGLTIVGLLLICISPCMMWKNEGRHMNELRRIDFCQNKAVVVNNADMPQNENTGQLVHFTGKVSVGEDALDLSPGPLNITKPLPKAVVIRRTCQIYQKYEESSQQVKNDVIGAGQTTTTTYTVREDWFPSPQVEVLQHLPEESNSRGVWDELVSEAGVPADLGAKAPDDVAVSGAAHVGGFGITKENIADEPGVFQCDWMPLPAEMVPEDIESLPELRKDRYGNLTTVEEGDQPANGDVMIKYEYAADGFDASFVVQQILSESDPETGVAPHQFGIAKGNVIDEKCCGKIHDDLGVIWMVRRGRHGLEEMINMAKADEEVITKVLRIVCWLALVAGWMMLFSIFTTLLSTLPILGGLGKAAFFIVALIVGTTCCCGVTAVAYIRYRPLVAFGILAVVGAITGIIIWRLDAAEAASSQPTSAPVKAPAFIFSDGTDVTVESIY